MKFCVTCLSKLFSLNISIILLYSSSETFTKYKFEFINVEVFLNEKRINPNEFQMEKEEEPEFEIPSNFSFDVDELTPQEEFQLEVEKRNVINAIIQGKGKKGQFAFQAFKDRLDEIFKLQKRSI